MVNSARATTRSQQGQWLNVHGQQMHVIDEGPQQGSCGTLVMVHGNPTWSFYFRRLIAHFSDRYRCIVPDHIGMGLSSKPEDEAYAYTLEQRIKDLDNLLEQLCPDASLTLILHDWGGMIGMGYAARHRSRISRLVLMNTAAFRLPRGKKLPWQLGMCRTPILGAIAVRAMNLFCLGAVRQCVKATRLSGADRARLLAPYDSWGNRIAVHRFVQDIPIRPGDISYDCVTRIEQSLEQFINCPIRIFWGGQDFVFDDDFLSEWQRFWPHAVIHGFPEAGHYVLEDAHEQIIPLLEEFLKVES